MSKIIDISVVIPVFNNEASLTELAQRLTTTLIKIQSEFEILFINDGSRDNSGVLLREISHLKPEIKVITLSRNFGQHPAICAGFEHATGEYIVLMDADLQDRPEAIPTLIDKLKKSNADVAYTIKDSSNLISSNRLTSIIYHYIFSKLVKTKVPLNIGTFRVFNKKFLEALLQFKEVNVLYGPLMFFMGYESCFIEIPCSDRAKHKSSYTFSKRLALAMNSLISYTDIPHKISLFLGCILIIGSFLYSLTIVVQRLIFDTSLPSGITLILLVLCLTFGSLMIFLGVIGNYIFRVYQEVLNRPRYLIQEKINI